MRTIERERSIIYPGFEGLSSLEKLRTSNICVMKFGGTSVGSAEAIENTMRFIDYHRQNGRPIVVVVSAMNGVTNDLLNICQNIKIGNEREASDIYNALLNRHEDVISRLNLGDLKKEIYNLFFDLAEELKSREMTPSQIDKVLSYGERLSARIVASRWGPTAKAIDSSDIIQTDDNFSEAKVDLDATRQKTRRTIFPLLQRGIIPVVTGFIGATKNGRITTLGRNSSDYTASLIGSDLDCKEVWICKEVNGIYSADPKKDKLAYRIDSMSQREAKAYLQKVGDKVLCLKALESILGRDIILRVRCVNNPSDEGTMIYKD